MSGGIHALRGFGYQATVILDRLLIHFDEHGVGATARPESTDDESTDDLDLAWVAVDGSPRRRFEQIKKRREDRDMNPTGEAWSLAQAARELIPGALANLDGNAHEQVWILGDEVEAELTDLIAAGQAASSRVPAAYWRVVHLLARNEALKVKAMEATARGRLMRWTIPADLPPDPDTALARLAEGFSQRAIELGANRAVADGYAAAARRLHARLPDVLARIRIHSLFGSEEEVALRVRERLERRYDLHPSVVQSTLFRNLRGFIDDIAKQPDRRFDQEEFELELRSVWPRMLPVREPPPLGGDHLPRADLSARFTTGWSGRALEAIGVSGAGKTLLAAEVCEQSRTVDPDRLVLYSEVRPDTGLRDVLVGAAFHLRRLGHTQPFPVAVEGTAANDTALDRLARVLSAIPKNILLLVDLVEGTCNEAFARDLATFVASLSSAACRIAVLGQESAFRHLSALDRGRLGVGSIDIRGFNIDEFVSLASRRHPDPDRALLHGVFRRVTAGRAAGLYAKLARSLADATSLKAMCDLAELPADEILERAERQRFARVSDGARSAAEKLVCFALPFGRAEAEEVFPDDNVGAAVRELLDLGLLRATGDSGYEMHETVRAGLERTIALRTRREAHGLLAAYYGRLGDVAAEVLHLERAGRSEEARERARAAFLRGERWAGLAGFVTAHGLVTPSEVVRTMAAPGKVESAYVLADVLSQLNQPIDVQEILAVLRGQPQRFLSDHQWASALVDACLTFDPNRLHELVQFGVGIEGAPDRREAGLSTILFAARRRGCAFGPETLALFDGAAIDAQRLLLPFLLADGRREALKRAFAFLGRDAGDGPGGRRDSWLENHLKVECLDDTVEFLAAVPAVPDGLTLARRSPLLGSVAPLVWRNRQAFRTHCVDILQAEGMEPAVQKAAIRVLVLLAEPRLIELCEALAVQAQSPVRGFAALAPSLVPSLVDRDRHEARLLDPRQDIEARMAALAVLASVGADLGALYERLRAAETSPERFDLWNLLFLHNAARAPFAAAIPLLEARLRSPDVNGADVFGGALASLGRLPGPEATEMLLGAVSHLNPRVRLAAVTTLRDRRSRTALGGLVQRFRTEEELPISVGLATAIAASGARSTGVLAAPARESEALSLWRCVLAARTRDATFAPRLVALASDASANWQLRRAAINAAGFLPFEAALARMLPILRERSPLTVDGHQDLGAHSFLCWLLLFDAPGLLPAFKGGRARFVTLVEDVLDGVWDRPIDRRGLPSRAEAAGWLHDRLRRHGWPENPSAPDAVVSELHIPLLHSAILRALRRAGRVDLIEAELARADHVWTATKCLLECVRAGRGGPGAADNLRSLVARSPVAGDERLARIVDGLPRNGREATPTAVLAEEVALVPQGTPLGYEEAVLALTGCGPDLDLKARAPVVLGTLTPEQFEHLSRLADPINDRHAVAERYLPEVTLGREGHSVARRQQTYSGASEPPGAWVRPALAAANRLDLPLQWHREILSGPLAAAYAERLLACLAATGDAEAFYNVLYRDPDLLLPHLCSDATRRWRAALIDDRMVPFLAVNLSSGTDEIFAGLCELARAINSPTIDSVLSALFRRWTGHFEGGQMAGPQRTSHHIWRAFHCLTGHPRFGLIEGWQQLLSPVLYAPVEWYEKQKVARVLERDPASYIQLESLLFKSEDWAHFYEDEIDRLEKAAERLFGQVRECARSGQRPPRTRGLARIVLAPFRRLWSGFLDGVRSRRDPHNGRTTASGRT